jgi:acetylornithine deacetylase/succinyl-diaminopimelate desuccinylase-like protein
MIRALALAAVVSCSLAAEQHVPEVTKALDYLRDNHERHLDKQVQIAEVPAPTFQEGERATLMADEFRRVGLTDVEIDAQGNVLGWRPGTSPGALVIAAHLDISFEPGVNTKVRKEGARWHGPGLADDSRGLVTLLAVAEAMNVAGLQTRRSLLFVADVQEEGLGDLNGVKYLFQRSPHRSRLEAFISVDGTDLDRIVNGGTGVKRYKVTVRGPGGHSYSNFGRPSASHAIGRIVAHLSTLEVPDSPKTTFNVGRIGGGTVVNAIAEDAWIEVDLRSDDPVWLHRIDQALAEAVQRGVADENRQRAASRTEVTAKTDVIGNRPAGATSPDDPLVVAAMAAARTMGRTPRLSIGSTDSNLPMSLGIPAITLSGGGRSDNAHSLDEWFEPANAWQGPQTVLLTILNYDKAP